MTAPENTAGPGRQGSGGRSDAPLPEPADLLPRAHGHPGGRLAVLLPGIRARIADPGSVVAYYEDSPRDGA